MNVRVCDNKGRWRNVVVAFRVSQEESDAINEAVYLSGYSKQDYIIKKLLNRDVSVMKSPKTYKALKQKMEQICEELQRLKTAGECTPQFLETINYVAKIYEQTKDGSNKTCMK